MNRKNKKEIGNALSLYDRSLFWDYGEAEIPNLVPELVIPRVTRYGTLEDIFRLFDIFPADVIRKVVSQDQELDNKEKTFLKYLCRHESPL